MCLDPGMAPCFSFLSSVVRTSSRMMELSSRPDFTFSKSISETSPIAVDDDLDDDDEDLRVAAVLRTFRIIQYRLCISKVAFNSWAALDRNIFCRRPRQLLQRISDARPPRLRQLALQHLFRLHWLCNWRGHMFSLSCDSGVAVTVQYGYASFRVVVVRYLTLDGAKWCWCERIASVNSISFSTDE